MGRAGDDVAFGLENRCVPTDQIPARVHAALSAVDFPYGAERATDALSGGERQRLALAGVLALRPDLLLLDEPTASLDPESAENVRAAVERAVEGRGVTLVVVDHRAEVWLPLVDRVVVLDGPNGVVPDGAPAEMPARAAGGPAAMRDLSGSPPEALVVAELASFRYPGAARDALTPTHAELREREVLAVTGPNGSGKSTLALLLGGLLAPKTGRVVATDALERGRGGERIAGWRPATLVRYVGSVFQDPEHQLLTGSVRDEVMLGPRRIGLPEAEAAARADELLASARLTHLAQANPFTLSGGEKRRLSVATALATRPRVLILDEPTFGQDDDDVADLANRLRGLSDEGTALCVVTHDDRFISALADRRLTLEARG
jgi:energy-coupling factor transport system ATP-binding protein